VPYFVDVQRRPLPTQYSATTLTPSGGLISSVLDIARFERALRDGLLLKPETLEQAWTPVADADGKLLPHGLGWFVQYYNGEKLVWQYGMGANGSSSLVVTVPGRGYTFVLLANSKGLFRVAPTTATELVASPFVRLFLGFSVA
jgi:CubicO group peptidase (beta-lactamase class C family)